MYHPYFRGKQYELLTVKELAPFLAANHFTPIIEPVRESLGSLQRTLAAVCESNGRAVVVINPSAGDHSEDGKSISSLLKSDFCDGGQIGIGMLLKHSTDMRDVFACIEAHPEHDLTLIHDGFTDPKALAEELQRSFPATKHVFFDPPCGKLYRRHFSGSNRVLVRDGFKKRRNKDHPFVEPFSDLNVTFRDEDMDGFGDFLIVGYDFAEGGGPAYAIAIHLTFVDPEKDNAMFIYHFVSERQDTPTDPAGKFAEALSEMMTTLDTPGCKVVNTDAVKEFRELHAKGHFPGLGYVKKLSMKHHIETLAAFLR